MKKQIKIICETEEDNDRIYNIMKSYMMDSFKNPDKQLIELKVEDLEDE